MLRVSELPGARWPPCADVRLRWLATRTRHLAFIYIYGRISIHFEWGDVILCRTELWLRWVPVRCVSCFSCGKSSRMFNFSRGNAYVSQSNCLSCITDSTGASQSDPVYAHVYKAASSKKKKMATKLRRWSYLYPKVVCLTFFCLDFFKVTEKYTLYNVKTPLLKLKNTSDRICEVSLSPI